MRGWHKPPGHLETTGSAFGQLSGSHHLFHFPSLTTRKYPHCFPPPTPRGQTLLSQGLEGGGQSGAKVYLAEATPGQWPQDSSREGEGDLVLGSSCGQLHPTCWIFAERGWGGRG